jgi:hypothetical protein
MNESTMRYRFSLAGLLICVTVLAEMAALSAAAPVWYPPNPRFPEFQLARSPTFFEFLGRLTWSGPLGLLLVFGAISAFRMVKRGSARRLFRRLAGLPTLRRDAFCSFCGRSYFEAAPFAEGPRFLFICQRCVAKCNDIFARELAKTQNYADAPPTGLGRDTSADPMHIAEDVEDEGDEQHEADDRRGLDA